MLLDHNALGTCHTFYFTYIEPCSLTLLIPHLLWMAYVLRSRCPMQSEGKAGSYPSPGNVVCRDVQFQGKLAHVITPQNRNSPHRTSKN